MNSAIRNVAGETFGLLTAIRYSHSVKGRAFWLCRCRCGTEVIRRGDKLRGSSRDRGCGCAIKSSKLTRTAVTYSAPFALPSYVITSTAVISGAHR